MMRSGCVVLTFPAALEGITSLLRVNPSTNAHTQRDRHTHIWREV